MSSAFKVTAERDVFFIPAYGGSPFFSVPFPVFHCFMAIIRIFTLLQTCVPGCSKTWKQVEVLTTKGWGGVALLAAASSSKLCAKKFCARVWGDHVPSPWQRPDKGIGLKKKAPDRHITLMLSVWCHFDRAWANPCVGHRRAWPLHASWQRTAAWETLGLLRGVGDKAWCRKREAETTSPSFVPTRGFLWLWPPCHGPQWSILLLAEFSKAWNRICVCDILCWDNWSTPHTWRPNLLNALFLC